jgi:hypothetical protein
VQEKMPLAGSSLGRGLFDPALVRLGVGLYIYFFVSRRFAQGLHRGLLLDSLVFNTGFVLFVGVAARLNSCGIGCNNFIFNLLYIFLNL